MKTGGKEGLELFISKTMGAISNASLYSPEHGQVKRLTAEAHAALNRLLGRVGELSFMVVEDDLIVDGKPVAASMVVSRFVRTLNEHGIGTIKFLQGVRPEEIKAIVTALSITGSERMEARSSEYVRLGKVDVKKDLEEDTEEYDTEEKSATISFKELSKVELAKIMEIYEGVRQNGKLRVSGLYEVVSAFVDTFTREAHPFIALAPLRALDEYTFTHSANVCILNLAQARAMGVDGPLLKDIGIAAMLHDIGKLFIPEDILTNPGKLDDSEWEIMRQHPVKGATHLLGTPGVPKLAVTVAYEHHMRYDFKGYPAVPRGWKQNLCSQITAISDFFDAMRTKRPYSDSVEADRIANMMRECSGKNLNPSLTGNFFRILKHVAEI